MTDGQIFGLTLAYISAVVLIAFLWSWERDRRHKRERAAILAKRRIAPAPPPKHLFPGAVLSDGSEGERRASIITHLESAVALQDLHERTRVGTPWYKQMTSTAYVEDSVEVGPYFPRVSGWFVYAEPPEWENG